METAFTVHFCASSVSHGPIATSTSGHPDRLQVLASYLMKEASCISAVTAIGRMLSRAQPFKALMWPIRSTERRLNVSGI